MSDHCTRTQRVVSFSCSRGGGRRFLRTQTRRRSTLEGGDCGTTELRRCFECVNAASSRMSLSWAYFDHSYLRVNRATDGGETATLDWRSSSSPGGDSSQCRISMIANSTQPRALPPSLADVASKPMDRNCPFRLVDQGAARYEAGHSEASCSHHHDELNSLRQSDACGAAHILRSNAIYEGHPLLMSGRHLVTTSLQVKVEQRPPDLAAVTN
nr:hypothetical protein Iba_chr12dCG7260 [Ipomoea batatas]